MNKNISVIKNKIIYVDKCMTLEILKQDSGLLSKPNENWKTFIPKKNDIAFINGENCDYKFDGKKWTKIEEENN